MFEKTILVTGGAGFIGTNFVEFFAQAHPEYRIVDLDAITYAGSEEVFEMQSRMHNVVPVRGDIRDALFVRRLLQDYDIEGVIHFAAESHVDNSIANPMLFVDTNVTGTVTLLNEAMLCWKRTGRLASARFHHVSTDEVYGSLGSEGFFTEQSPYAPNGPYSASKASSDLLVRAYHRTYGLNATISNCSNNYGPWQNSEKLIPTILRKSLAHETIPLYGTGSNVRDWIWVLDHCRAVDRIFHEGRPGQSYNVGAHCEKSNLEMMRTVCGILDRLVPWRGRRYAELITCVEDRPGHDFRYAVDPSKISTELGWRPLMRFEEGLEQTVRWYVERHAEQNRRHSATQEK